MVRSLTSMRKRKGIVWNPPTSTFPPVIFSSSATTRRRTMAWNEFVVEYQTRQTTKSKPVRNANTRYFRNLQRRGLSGLSFTAGWLLRRAWGLVGFGFALPRAGSEATWKVDR